MPEVTDPFEVDAPILAGLTAANIRGFVSGDAHDSGCYWGVNKGPPLGIMRMNWIGVNLPSQLLQVAAGGGKGPYGVRTAGPDGNGRLLAATVAVDPLGLTPGYNRRRAVRGRRLNTKRKREAALRRLFGTGRHRGRPGQTGAFSQV